MALRVDCPHCGSRPFTEFRCAGEVHAVPQGRAAIDETLEDNFARVWLRDNGAGVQLERWFHFAGCRRWLTLERDTTNNRIVRLLGGVPGGVPGEMSR